MPREGLDIILRTGEPWRVSNRRGQEDTWRGHGQRQEEHQECPQSRAEAVERVGGTEGALLCPSHMALQPVSRGERGVIKELASLVVPE